MRGAIRRVFELWDRCGSGRQVVTELAAEGQRLPRRRITERRIRWEPPDYGAVHEILTNPNYAGAYAYGRHRTVKTVDADRGVKISQVKTPIAEWRVLITEHHPGYVTWEQYLETQQRLLANARPTGQGGGAAREGSALLQGLVRCAKCGRKMKVKYSGPNGRTHTYLCESTYQTQATSVICQTIGGLRFDHTVVDAFLDAVTPAGVDATAAAVDQLEADHADRRRLQLLAVERVEYEAERRRRQFDACEPENRLVARSLERAYEDALADVERQRLALAELDRQRPAPLTEPERRALRRLAGELGRVWNAQSTTDRDRKELLRALLDDVVLDVDRARETASVELIWQGGARTELPVRVKHSTMKRSGTRPELVDLVRRLAMHSSDREIAIVLSKHGWKSPTGLPFTQRRVRDLRERANIPPAPRTPPAGTGVSIMQAARELGVSTMTIRRWLCGRAAPRRADRRARPVADQAHRRCPPAVRADRPRWVRQARRGRPAARRRPPDCSQSGPRRAPQCGSSGRGQTPGAADRDPLRRGGASRTPPRRGVREPGDRGSTGSTCRTNERPSLRRTTPQLPDCDPIAHVELGALRVGAASREQRGRLV